MPELTQPTEYRLTVLVCPACGEDVVMTMALDLKAIPRVMPSGALGDVARPVEVKASVTGLSVSHHCGPGTEEPPARGPWPNLDAAAEPRGTDPEDIPTPGGGLDRPDVSQGDNGSQSRRPIPGHEHPDVWCQEFDPQTGAQCSGVVGHLGPGHGAYGAVSW